MTPADCDLRGLAFMPLDVIRLMDSDMFALTTGEEFKAALALWCKSWTQIPAGSLPEDDRVLAHLSGAGARWRKVKDQAIRNWVKCSDGRLYHPTVCEKAIDAWDRRSDHVEAKDNKLERQRRWRERCKYLSKALRDAGFTPPKGASVETLERLVAERCVDAGASTKASTPASTVDEGETGKTGTGTGTLSSEEERSSSAQPSLSDPNKLAWKLAIEVLGQGGLTEARAKALFGKLLSDHKLAPRDLVPALAQAQANETLDPQAYLAKAAQRLAAGPRVPAEPQRRQSFV